MHWYAIVFTHSQLSRLDHTRVEDEFQLSFLTAGSPDGMALFALKTFPLHPVYYISPAGARHVSTLPESFEAMHCQPPPLQELELIAGEYRAPLEIQLQLFRKSEQPGRHDHRPFQ